MFDIEYKGANAVIISTKNSRLMIDPKLSLVGLKDLNVKDAVELTTEERFVIDDDDAKLIINGPGEYGIDGFDITGVPARRHIDTENEGMLSTIYRIMIGESRIGVVGNIDKKLSDEQLEALGVVDILILPVGGGGYTLDSVDAAKVISAIDPKVVIPVHYADSSLKYEVPQDDLERFVTQLGAPVETVSKYKYKPLVGGGNTGLSVVVITKS
ncbi:Zn-dependent hydrolase [Candidatus Saccharibacteria bacterium]|nr:Zn-dependent hydrolase [Candidatus Saccharibacteria bacterium]